MLNTRGGSIQRRARRAAPFLHRTVAFLVAAAMLLPAAVARHFWRRSERQYLGCHADPGPEFERVKAVARKGQLDEIGNPPFRRLGRFGDVDSVATFFRGRAAISRADPPSNISPLRSRRPSRGLNRAT
jgi:hypothetical protein